MINLMYVVLMALLALNVSTEVLNGFSVVEESLRRTTSNASQENQAIYDDFEEQVKKNPQKVKQWFDKAMQVRQMSDSLYQLAADLKLAIVQEADGSDGDINNIRNKEDLEAATQVMLAPGRGRGDELYRAVSNFRERILTMVTDETQRKSIASSLSTTPSSTAKAMGKNWQEYLFEDMPVAAAVTLLSKLQNDVRYAEGEVLNHLLTLTNTDLSQLKVNWIDAFVIPQSRVVMRGSKYQSQIVLAAIDSTQRPTVYVNGARLSNNKGLYEVTTSSSGTFDYSGYIEVVGRDGVVYKRDFKSSYTVIDPVATVSATMMNVFYTGIDNPVSIAVPGLGEGTLSASMTNGTLTRSGNGWIARPAQVGAECVITVSVEIDGVRTNVGSTTFKARKLPDPTPYIALGGDNRFKGGRLAKGTLLSAPGLHAAIDDGLLDIEFKVVSFETISIGSMGEAIPEISAGSSFSERQKASFKRMKRGTRFFISRVKAVGPDGVTRDISPMDIIVN